MWKWLCANIKHKIRNNIYTWYKGLTTISSYELNTFSIQFQILGSSSCYLKVKIQFAASFTVSVTK